MHPCIWAVHLAWFPNPPQTPRIPEVRCFCGLMAQVFDSGFRIGAHVLGLRILGRGPSLEKPTPPDCQFLVGNGGIDPYSSPYIIPDNSLQNLFPHSLQSTRQQRLLEVGPWLLDFDTAWAILRTRGRVPGFGLGPSRATIYCCFLVLLSSCAIHAIQ